MMFIFSFIWSCGGNLHDNPRDNSRVKFSAHLKGKIFNIHNGFPFDGDIYDYYIDFSKKEFIAWSKLVTDYKYSKTVPYFNILVPTSDTVKFKTLTSLLIKNSYNLLLSGETGVGKSVIL